MHTPTVAPNSKLAPIPTSFGQLAKTYLDDYELQRFRSLVTAKQRVAHLREHFGTEDACAISADRIRQYQLQRRQAGAAAATVNRETSALKRMFQLAYRYGVVAHIPVFPTRLRENPPRQGFFEHEEFLKVRAQLPSAYQDVLDFAYYSGWRRSEIWLLTWEEVDLSGGVVRLAATRSKTDESRLLPLTPPLRTVLERRLKRKGHSDTRVFGRDGVAGRVWRTALRDACVRAGVPHRLLHDCRRTAARNLVRAGVPERVAMMLTGHKTREVFDRYNIVNERELFEAGQSLVSYLRRAPHKGTPSPRNRTITVQSESSSKNGDGEIPPVDAGDRLTREELYARVWEAPISHVASQLGLSDCGLAKVCARHNIPVPFRGYWARRAAGQPVAPLPLPPGSPVTIAFRRFRH